MLSAHETRSVTLQLLGAPCWKVTSPIGTALSRLDAALLAVLALDGEQPRDRLASWLWPEVPLKNANLNLRQRLHTLRRRTGHTLVHANATLRLHDDVRTDLQQPNPASDGELLGGQDYGDREALDTWVNAARLRLQGQRADHLAGQAAQLEAQGALAAAIALCERIVAQVPQHEHTWRRLMRLHFMRSDRTAAITTFERFENLALRELGLRPSAETVELLQSIERMDQPAKHAAGRLPTALIHPPQMVGRHGELQTMAHAWSQGRAFMVLGVGGVGKSRLMREFACGLPGVAEVRSRPGDATMPYALATQMLRQVIEVFTPEMQDGVRSELARLLPTLGRAARGQAQQALLWQAVEQMLLGCVTNGLSTLVVDDLHHSDVASIELLRWLLAAAGLSSLRWCLAARPDEPGPATSLLMNWCGDSSRIEPIHLGVLSLPDIAALLDSLQLKELKRPSSKLAAALHRHAGGHPYFTLETLKAMVLSGQDRATQALPRPPTAHAMIEQRLSRLGDSARDLLRMAALASESGTDLPLDAAAKLMQCTPLALSRLWAELETAQALQGAGFAHDLIRECALADVPQALRPMLHRQLAMALASFGNIEAARLATHWWHAQAWPEAARCWATAAAAARRAGRLEEHETLLERAAQSCALTNDTAGQFEHLAHAIAAGMMRLGSEAALPRIEALQGLATSDEQRARCLVLLSEAQLNLSHYVQAQGNAEAALALAMPGSALAADALSLHGRALAMNGQPAQAVERLRSACAQALALGDEQRALVAHSALAHALYAAARLGEALQAQTVALACAHRLDDPTELAQTEANLATLSSLVGDVGTAYRSSRSAEQRYQAMGADAGHGVFNRITLARCAAQMGRFDEAMAALEALAPLQADRAGDMLLTMSQLATGLIRLLLGRADWVLAERPTLEGQVPNIAQAGVWLLQARAQRSLGHDPAQAVAALQALDTSHPGLLDEPALCLEWCRLESPELAVERLRRVAAKAHEGGAQGAVTSLGVREVECLLDIDPAKAARLARSLLPRLKAGLHVSTYPPEAWWALARALHRGGSQRMAQGCLQEARGWIANATMPSPSASWRETFENGNLVNRAVLSAHACL